MYAVEPVGVAHTTPSQPNRDNGRPSTSTTTSSIRWRAAFSTLASLSAHVLVTSSPSRNTPTSMVSRSSEVYRPSTIAAIVLSTSSGSDSARKPT